MFNSLEMTSVNLLYFNTKYDLFCKGNIMKNLYDKKNKYIAVVKYSPCWDDAENAIEGMFPRKRPTKSNIILNRVT